MQPTVAIIGTVGKDGVAIERGATVVRVQPAAVSGRVAEHPVNADGSRGVDDVYSAVQLGHVAAADAQPLDSTSISLESLLCFWYGRR